jgi:hypothetical protein
VPTTDRPPAALLDPWLAGAQIGRQLGAWAALSVAAGAALLLASDDVAARAFAVQCLVWGAIDGAIALAGGLGLRRARARGEVGVAARASAERRRLRRLLRLNALLDVGYVAVGVVLLLTWRTEAGMGHGWGIVVQGGFLLVFDAVHAWRLRDPAAAPRGG